MPDLPAPVNISNGVTTRVAQRVTVDVADRDDLPPGVLPYAYVAVTSAYGTSGIALHRAEVDNLIAALVALRPHVVEAP